MEFHSTKDFPTINRFAVVLVPTEAYLAWSQSCPDGDPNTELDEVREEPTAFLIPESDEEPDEYLRRHFKAMFEQELASWCTDLSFWPKDLSFKTFKKFFTVHVSTMVFDLGTGRIIKDDEDE